MMGIHSLVSQGSKLRISNSYTAHFSEEKFKKCSSEGVPEETAKEESWQYLHSSYDGLVDAKQLLGNHLNGWWSNDRARDKESSLIDCHHRDLVWAIQDSVTQGGHTVPEGKQEVGNPLNV